MNAVVSWQSVKNDDFGAAMKFTKMHGTGNDYVVIADFKNTLDISPDAVRRLCDRHFGLGADCLVRITHGTQAPWFLDFRNGDGTSSPFCANGVGCVGKWLGDRGHAEDAFDIEVGAGVKSLRVRRDAAGKVDTVIVDMGKPEYSYDVAETIEVDKQRFDVSCISMGNPHAVLFVDDVDAVPLETVGSLIQSHAERFPEGVNVSVAAVRPDGVIRQRTFERGVGETLACGTGAAAVAVAAQRRRLVAGPTVQILLRGGPLTLEWSEGKSVIKTGSAVQVFESEIDAESFGITAQG